MTACSPNVIQTITQALETACPDARGGLGESLFLAVSRLVPMVNVDLLVLDDANRLLMSWRHDRFYGPGWHIPGGVVRFKETLNQRIAAVARQELGAMVAHDPTPLKVSELFNPDRDTRGHFLSLAYRCHLASDLRADLVKPGSGTPQPGQCAWFAEWPSQVISQHLVYRDLFTQLRTHTEY